LQCGPLQAAGPGPASSPPSQKHGILGNAPHYRMLANVGVIAKASKSY